MKEEMLANERKPWQPPRQRQFSDNEEEESRPKACVGICYYNKLMALEAKEDLASHNLVYKDQKEGKSSDNNVNVIDEDDQGAGRKKSLSSGDLGTIYIDNGENSEENHSIDISQHG